MKRLAVVARIGLVATGLLLAGCAPVREPATLTEQARTARTRDDHLMLARGYREYAVRLRGDATKHLKLAESLSDLAQEVDANGRRARTTEAFRRQEARHCRALADYLSKAAVEADALAAAHAEAARTGEGQ